MNNNRWFQVLIVLLVFIAAGFLSGMIWQLVAQFSGILGLFFAAWLLAFVLSPIARALSARGLPQVISIAVVYLALALLVVGLALIGFPQLANQLQGLLNNLNGYTSQLIDLGNSAEETLRSWGVKVEDLNLQSIYGTVASQIQNVSGSMLGVVTGVAAFLFNTVLVLLLSFYIMKDGDMITNNIISFLPENWAGEARLVTDSISRSFGGYIRGQLVFGVMYGIVNTIIMLLFGLDYVLVASIVAGFAVLIPLVGNVLAIAPPFFVLLVSPDQIHRWWILAIILVVVQGIMLQVVSPRIMSQAVGMHPLVVIGALLVGNQVAGVWGAIFGIPVAGVLSLIARPFLERLIGFLNSPNNTPYVSVHVQPQHVQIQHSSSEAPAVNIVAEN